VDFEPGAVREVHVEKAGEVVVARRDGDGWRLTAPEAAAADGPMVEGLLAFVRRLEKERTIDGAADLGDYGLAAPPIRLRLVLGGGETLALALGRPNPAGTGVYAAVDGAPLIFLAPLALARELAKSPYAEQLRDRRVLPVEVPRVRRLEIERAGVRVAVARLDAHRWQVERPFRAAGDDGIIRDLLWRIGTARSREVIREPRPVAAYGLDRPHARVRIVDDTGVTRTLTVVLDEADASRLFTVVEGTSRVVVAEASLLAALAIEPEVLHDRQLLAHDAGAVERITIQYPAERLVLERAGAAWRVTEPAEGAALDALVENLLEILPNLRFTAVADRRPHDLAPYGLDRPARVVTVQLAGGRPLPAVSVGRQEGDEHFVMVAGKPAVYKVNSRLIRVLPDEPADARWSPLPERLKREFDKRSRS
jgi:hypothetical protein